MQTVFKYVLLVTDVQTVHMPRSAKPLSVAVQKGSICVWAKVDSEQPSVDHRFAIHGTGRELAYPEAAFIGSVLLYGDELVFHIFDLGEV